MLFEREVSVSPSGHERRAMRRFDIRLPALVKLPGNGFQELLTETQNVSARGVFFHVDRPVTCGRLLSEAVGLTVYPSDV